MIELQVSWTSPYNDRAVGLVTTTMSAEVKGVPSLLPDKACCKVYGRISSAELPQQRKHLLCANLARKPIHAPAINNMGVNAEKMTIPAMAPADSRDGPGDPLPLLPVMQVEEPRSP